jgi:hypothetical protein
MGFATTVAVISAVAAIAGTAVSVAGSIEQAEAAEKAGKFNEAVARNNAQAAADQARFEADRIRKRNTILLGRQKALYAKAGILDSGSTLDVFMDSATEGELEAMSALYVGSIQSNYHRSAGMLAGMEAKSAATAARYRAAGTLLTGIGKVAEQSGPYFEGFGNNPRTVQGPGGTYARGTGSTPGSVAYYPTFARGED